MPESTSQSLPGTANQKYSGIHCLLHSIQHLLGEYIGLVITILLVLIGNLILFLSSTEIQVLLQGLSEEDKRDNRIKFALDVRKAWSLGNYCKLCLLYSAAPGMSSNIMDWFMSRERKKALKVILKSYRPSIPVSLLEKTLAFSREDCLSFLNQFDIKFIDSDNIDCKTSQVIAVAS